MRSRTERFLTEQWERLQREVDRQLAEWQESFEQWLAEHPLTQADLEDEATVLAPLGFELRVE